MSLDGFVRPQGLAPLTFEVVFRAAADRRKVVSAVAVGAHHSRFACWALLATVLVSCTTVATLATGSTTSGGGARFGGVLYFLLRVVRLHDASINLGCSFPCLGPVNDVGQSVD